MDRADVVRPAYGAGGRLLVLGNKNRDSAASGNLSTPVPVNTPSLRRENNGQDISVPLVPSGGVGWGANKQPAPTAQVFALYFFVKCDTLYCTKCITFIVGTGVLVTVVHPRCYRTALQKLGEGDTPRIIPIAVCYERVACVRVAHSPSTVGAVYHNPPGRISVCGRQLCR